MILITGASGNIGETVLAALRGKGAKVRAMSRHPQAQNNEIETVFGDFDEPESLIEPLKSVRVALLNSTSGPDLVKQQTAFIEAARRAGVRRIVTITSLGTGNENIDVQDARWHREVEQTVEDNNFDYAHLRPALFMQNIFHFAPGLRETGTIHYPFGDVRHAQIDVRDISAAAATCLLREGEIRAAFHLTGQEAITFEEMAAMLTEVTGRAIRYRALEPDEFAGMIKNSGVPEWLIEHIVEMSQALKSGLGTTPTTDVRKVTGRAPISFRRFVEDYKKQLRELVNPNESNHDHTETKHNH